MGGISVIFLMSFLSLIYFMFIAILSFIILYIVISYTMTSITVMSMRKKLKYKNNFISFIPVFNKYLLGNLVNEKLLGALSSILTFLLMGFGTYLYICKNFKTLPFTVFIILLIITFIIDTVITYKMYDRCDSKYKDIVTIFNCLSLGILRPIFIFLVRNKNKKE